MKLLYFYSPSCPICQKDFPKLQAAIDGIPIIVGPGAKPLIELEKINVVKDTSLAPRYGVIGTPTIVIPRSGDHYVRLDGIPDNIAEVLQAELRTQSRTAEASMTMAIELPVILLILFSLKKIFS